MVWFKRCKQNEFCHPETRAFCAQKDPGEPRERRVLCDARIARSARILIFLPTIYNAQFTPPWIWGSKDESRW
jgi:hypothetical protein